MNRSLTTGAILAAVLLTAPAWAQESPAKKELAAKLLQAQRSGIEGMARGLVEQSAGQVLDAAGQAMQAQVPPEQRETVGKSIEAAAKRYVDESAPLVRDRAIKLAPTTLGTSFEAKFTEDELRQLVAWFESPVNRKYQQVFPEIQDGFAQALVADTKPVVEPKLRELERQIRTALGSAPEAGKAAAKPAAAPKKPAKGN